MKVANNYFHAFVFPTGRLQEILVSPGHNKPLI